MMACAGTAQYRAQLVPVVEPTQAAAAMALGGSGWARDAPLAGGLRPGLYKRSTNDMQGARGLGTVERPHPLQQAFVDEQAVQYGYWTSGMIMSAKALFDRNRRPTLQAIKSALEGDLCRCALPMEYRRHLCGGARQECAISLDTCLQRERLALPRLAWQLPLPPQTT
jgi:hypothetical protein